MRLFVGTFARIKEYERLKEKFGRLVVGRWVDERNLHITFKFLGEVDDENEIISDLKNIEYPKDEIVKFESFGVFGKKIFFVSSKNDILYRLNSKIEERLRDKYQKNREFIPHITVMRIKKIIDDDFFTVMEKSRAEVSIKLKLSLIKSEHGRYEIIEEF